MSSSTATIKSVYVLRPSREPTYGERALYDHLREATEQDDGKLLRASQTIKRRWQRKDFEVWIVPPKNSEDWTVGRLDAYVARAVVNRRKELASALKNGGFYELAKRTDEYIVY